MKKFENVKKVAKKAKEKVGEFYEKNKFMIGCYSGLFVACVIELVYDKITKPDEKQHAILQAK